MAIDAYVRYWRTVLVCVLMVGALSLPEQLVALEVPWSEMELGGNGLILSGLAVLCWNKWVTQLHPKAAFWHVHGGFSLLIDSPHFLAYFMQV